MYQKLGKECRENAFWRDFYKYRQDTFIPEANKEYWDSVEFGGYALADKYKGEPFEQLALDVIAAHQHDIARRAKEMGKDNCNSDK